MKFITGFDRNQAALFPVTLEQSIDQDNEVRIIDLFVDSLPLKDFGFKMEFGEPGRPAYHPTDLLKLYIYGYLNKIIKRFKTSVLDSNIYPLCFDHHVNQLIFTRKLTIMAGF